MKITKKLAKELKDYIKETKRYSNLIDKQLVNADKEFPYIVFEASYDDVGFKFEFSTDDKLNERLRVDDPEIVAYAMIDKGLFLIFEQLDYGEIDLEDYIEQATNYIQNKLISRLDADEIIKERRRLIKSK